LCFAQHTEVIGVGAYAELQRDGHFHPFLKETHPFQPSAVKKTSLSPDFTRMRNPELSTNLSSRNRRLHQHAF